MGSHNDQLSKSFGQAMKTPTPKTPAIGLMATLHQKAKKADYAKLWLTLFWLSFAMLFPLALVAEPIWDASVNFTPSSQLTSYKAYGKRVLRWLGLGVLVFSTLAAVSLLTGFGFPVVMTGLSAVATQLLWSGAIGLGAMGLFATLDIMRDGVVFKPTEPDSWLGLPQGYQPPLDRRASAHIKYFLRWFLPSVLFTALIVLSAGAILPTIAIPGAASTTLFASMSSGLGLMGYGVWAQLGIMAGGVLASLTATHLLGTYFMYRSTRYNAQTHPKWRAFLRYFAKAMHVSGFAVVCLLAFSNVALAAATFLGVAGSAQSATAPAAATTIAAAAPAAETASIGATLQALGIMYAIFTALSALPATLLGLFGRWLNKQPGPDVDKKGATRAKTIDGKGSVAAIVQDLPRQYFYSKLKTSANGRANHALMRELDSDRQTVRDIKHATIEIHGQKKELFFLPGDAHQGSIYTYDAVTKTYTPVDNHPAFSIKQIGEIQSTKPENRSKDKISTQVASPTGQDTPALTQAVRDASAADLAASSPSAMMI